MKWIWPAEAVVLAIHDEQIAEHGGAAGVRDLGLLRSAMARPANFAAYEDSDISLLATSYAFGIVRNHPFTDGNKRTGLVVAELFLALNGFKLSASDADCVAMILQVADGSMAEAAFAAWVRTNLAKARSGRRGE